MEGYQLAKLYGAGDVGSQTPLIPELYRAKCVTMHGDKILLQGYENGDGAPVKQEWAVVIVERVTLLR